MAPTVRTTPASAAPPLTEQQQRVGRAASAHARSVHREPDAPAEPKAIVKPPEPTDAERRMGELLDELEAIELIPEADRTDDDDARQKAIADELAAAGAAHEEQGVKWYKPEENAVFTCVLEGQEIHPNDLSKDKDGTQRAYRIVKGGEVMLLGETWGLKSLSRYPSGTRIVVRSLGKFDLGKGQSVHKYEISPKPGPREILPVLFDCRAATQTVEEAPF